MQSGIYVPGLCEACPEPVEGLQPDYKTFDFCPFLFDLL